MLRILALALFAVALASCDLSTGLIEERRVGTIGYPENVLIAMPDTVDAGQAFTVTVRTLGPDGCWERDRTEVDVSGLRVTIVPYDIRRVGGGAVCTAAIVEIMHDATLTFGQPGVGRIDVMGRDGTAERSIVVE